MRMSGGIFEAAIILFLSPIVAIVDHFGHAFFQVDHVQRSSADHARPIGCGIRAQVGWHASRSTGRRICPKRPRVKGFPVSWTLRPHHGKTRKGPRDLNGTSS